MASVSIRVWVGGKFCSVASLMVEGVGRLVPSGATEVGVPRRACLAIGEGICSIVDLLWVEEGWLLIDPESFTRNLARDRFLVVGILFLFSDEGVIRRTKSKSFYCTGYRGVASRIGFDPLTLTKIVGCRVIECLLTRMMLPLTGGVPFTKGREATE